MRRKNTYIEEINLHEFKKIFLLYPIVTTEIIRDIIHFDLSVNDEEERVGGIDYDRVHKENRIEKKM